MRKFHLGTLCGEKKGSATVRDGIAFYEFLLVWPEVLSVDDIFRSFISSCCFWSNPLFSLHRKWKISAVAILVSNL